MDETLTTHRDVAPEAAADGHVPWQPPRLATGTYRVVVERMRGDGIAEGRVIAMLSAPTDEEFEEIYGPSVAQHIPPTGFSFIGGLPGEEVVVEATWRFPRPGRKRAKRTPDPDVRVVQVLAAAPERVAAQCPVFGVCGGCQLQHLAYDAQLAWKRERVREHLAAVGLADAPVLATAGCDDPWHYRNHMRFSVDRIGRIGLTARGSHHLLPLRACPIAERPINDALNVLAYTPQPRPQALVRYGVATGQMVIQPAPDETTRRRIEETGVTLRDPDFEESLHGRRYRVRPSSFFQTNTRQAERMADLVLAGLPDGRDQLVVDAYCGVGTFAGLLAPHVARVLAVEESASAVRDARANLADLPNVEVVQAKVEDWLPGIAERVDALVIDPPRAGCQRPVLDALAERRVSHVVYVSCAPDTLARDLAYLCRTRGAYRVRSVQPLDMFPQTAHIEAIALLEAL